MAELEINFQIVTPYFVVGGELEVAQWVTAVVLSKTLSAVDIELSTRDSECFPTSPSRT